MQDQTEEHYHDAVQSLKPSCGEQLVYIAAFVVGANVVFGDRPKHDTYLRLHNSASLVDLDYAYGVQVGFAASYVWLA